MSNPISIVDLSEAQKQKESSPKTFATLGKWIDQIQEGDLPALAVKDNPRFLAFLKGVCHHLPDQTSIDAGTHNPNGFYPEDCSVWLNSPLVGYEYKDEPILNMSEPDDEEYCGIALNVIVHEASKQGLTVWMDHLGLGFLPDRHIVVAQTQDARFAKQFKSMYDAPELPSSEEMAQEREEMGQLSLKESIKRISTWCSVHLFPLGFRLEKQTLEKNYGDLSYVRITTEGWDRIKLRLRKEKQTKCVDMPYFEKGLFEISRIEFDAKLDTSSESEEEFNNKVPHRRVCKTYFSRLLTEEQKAAINKSGIKGNHRLDPYDFPIINTTADWKLVEKYYFNDALLKNLSWFERLNSVAGIHQYFLQIPKEQTGYDFDSPSQLICAYLLSVPEYETVAIKTLQTQSNTRKLKAYLDAHITPYNGIKPEYRISAPIDDPIPTPAPPVLPVLTEERYGLHLVVLPAGSFDMGSDRNRDECPIHRVHVPSFALGMYPVTQQQWEAVMGHNPSFFKGVNCPVESITWFDAQAFIVKLNEQTGQTYRLPSEAEWEYACKAGTTGKWYFGEDEALLQDHAWYADNSDLRTHPVGQKQPNPFGLYDMLGNVGEWCQDAGADNYHSAPTDGSARINTSSDEGDIRIFRGGCWSEKAMDLSSTRRYTAPRNAVFGPKYTVLSVTNSSYHNITLGLRLAMTLK